MSAEQGIFMLQQSMRHAFIDTKVSTPKIPDFLYEWLYEMYECHATDHFHQKQTDLTSFITAMCLVQSGLEVHDQIRTNVHTYSNEEIPMMQIHVLQGDYYSSKFYHLLSKNGDVKGIQNLCLAIMDVNRKKVAIRESLNQGQYPFEKHFEIQVQIRSMLFETFADAIVNERKNMFIDGLRWIAAIRYLNEEQECFVSGHSLASMWLGVEQTLAWEWSTDFYQSEWNRIQTLYSGKYDDPLWLEIEKKVF